jgi:DNA-binding transcriptional LysR family regulator
MDPRVELRHLRYFVAVAEELHFGRAALRLHLAQPPLSQQIRRLEEIVGAPLFLRTSRSVRLTAAGEVLLERARRTLRLVEEDLEEARLVGRGAAGGLRVGIIGSLTLTPVPELFGRYRREYPRVQLLLQDSYTSGVTAGLRSGTLDVGFLRDGGPVPGLHVEVIYREPFLAMVPAGHRLAAREAISAGELRDEPFVLFPTLAGERAYERTLSLCEAHGFRPAVVQEAPHWLTILRLVGAGLGVTIAPACVAQIAGDGVACLPIVEPRRGGQSRAQVTSEIELAYGSGDERPLVLAFASMVRRSFGLEATPGAASKESRNRKVGRAAKKNGQSADKEGNTA